MIAKAANSMDPHFDVPVMIFPPLKAGDSRDFACDSKQAYARGDHMPTAAKTKGDSESDAIHRSHYPCARSHISDAMVAARIRA